MTFRHPNFLTNISTLYQIKTSTISVDNPLSIVDLVSFIILVDCLGRTLENENMIADNSEEPALVTCSSISDCISPGFELSAPHVFSACRALCAAQEIFSFASFP